jgi:hypothetical protein
MECQQGSLGADAVLPALRDDAGELVSRSDRQAHPGVPDLGDGLLVQRTISAARRSSAGCGVGPALSEIMPVIDTGRALPA